MNQDKSDSRAEANRAKLSRNPWLVFLSPFVVYMLVGSLEPTQPTPDNPSPAASRFGIGHEAYPLVYTLKIALTIASMAFVWPGYRQFPVRVSPLAIGVGVVGVVLWVGICHFQFERRLFAPLGLENLLSFGQRPAYNPLAHSPLLRRGRTHFWRSVSWAWPRSCRSSKSSSFAAF